MTIRRIAANRDFIQGNPEPLKRLYSHADDITIFGGFGGLARGWAETAPRLDWASSQFAGWRLVHRHARSAGRAPQTVLSDLSGGIPPAC